MGLKDFFKAYQEYNAYKRMISALPDSEKPRIAFYSEMGTDQIYFNGIIRELVDTHQQKIIYFTSSEMDPMYQNPMDAVKAFYLGEGMFRTILFSSIDIPLFVMTLPDLEMLQLKRSHYPVHYAYIFHSLVSTHMIYRHKAFDAYDTLFCVGPHHNQEIRETEKIYGLPEKSLVNHGYPRIDKIVADYQDYLNKNISENTHNNGTPHVLIAPSWGPTSISNLCIDPMLEVLLKEDYQVTYRPHPMTLRQEGVMINALKNKFGSKKNFTLEDNISSAESLFNADVMISDWSGVALEFGLGTSKPVVFIDTPRKVNNPEYEKLMAVPVEVSLREELGEIVSPESLETLPEVINTILQNLSLKTEQIETLREKTVYNLGQADKVGAEELLKLLN